MTYTEKTGELLQVPQGYYMAHCVSGDYSLGAGTAKKFDEIYNMRFKLHKNFPIQYGNKYANVGKALLIDNVFNLVTKPRWYHKPRLETLFDALVDMKEQCEAKDITRLAITRLGCGRDKLDWEDVSQMIQDVFEDTDVDISVYTQQIRE